MSIPGCMSDIFRCFAETNQRLANQRLGAAGVTIGDPDQLRRLQVLRHKP
jgi:hypothetical protein